VTCHGVLDVPLVGTGRLGRSPKAARLYYTACPKRKQRIRLTSTIPRAVFQTVKQRKKERAKKKVGRLGTVCKVSLLVVLVAVLAMSWWVTSFRVESFRRREFGGAYLLKEGRPTEPGRKAERSRGCAK
jgi:hypothetical protein